MRWEYLTVAWENNRGVFIWPGGLFDIEWFKGTFPKTRVEEGTLSLHCAGLPVAKGWRLRNLSACDGHFAAAIIAHLGEQGWEAIRIAGLLLDPVDATTSGGGAAWFKRPLPEKAADEF